MAKVQTQFDAFQDTIKIPRFSQNALLREKRDVLRARLHERLPGVFKAHGETCPKFYFQDAGSYAMGTGVVPTDCDFDIDQGLYFVLGTAAYPDPVVLKERVYEALDGHTDDVRMRRPCITVYYRLNGEPAYHVDIAIYSEGAQNPDGRTYLAKGKSNSSPENRVWEVANPEGLSDTLLGRFSGPDRDQFRHTTRYLKRWKDENFSPNGAERPIGIGLTVAVQEELEPSYSDSLSTKPDDLQALRTIVPHLVNRFMLVFNPATSRYERRLQVYLPVEPRNDLFARMSEKQMEKFESKLKDLQTALDFAADAVDPVAACEELQRVFGDDFPVPLKEQTARRHAPAISTSSSSA